MTGNNILKRLPMHILRNFYPAVLLLAFLQFKMVLSFPCSVTTDGGLKKSTCSSSEALFSVFDKKPRNQTPLPSPLRNYFFAFEDHASGGSTRIIDGAELSDTLKLYTPIFIPNSGYNDSSYGLFLEFEIGEPLANHLADSVYRSGFAGVGFFVYDSFTASYWDEKREHFKYFYFDYLCSGDFQELTLEIHDYFDVTDFNEPNRQSVRGAGVVWHKHLPSTGTGWQHALISLDSLTCHYSSDEQSPLPLDRKRLAKFLFKVYGGKGEKGKIVIDNLYFGNGAKVQTTVPDVKSVVRKEITALYKNGMILCRSNLPFGYSEIQANLYSLEGKLVFTGTFEMQSLHELSIQIPNIPAGRYLLCLKTDGKFQDNKRAIPVFINK